MPQGCALFPSDCSAPIIPAVCRHLAAQLLGPLRCALPLQMMSVVLLVHLTMHAEPLQLLHPTRSSCCNFQQQEQVQLWTPQIAWHVGRRAFGNRKHVPRFDLAPVASLHLQGGYGVALRGIIIIESRLDACQTQRISSRISRRFSSSAWDVPSLLFQIGLWMIGSCSIGSVGRVPGDREDGGEIDGEQRDGHRRGR